MRFSRNHAVGPVGGSATGQSTFLPIRWLRPSAILLFFIQFYRWIISPAQVFLFGGGSGCRFTPTCSQYAAEAIRQHGALAGSLMAAKRICRCHPLGDCGYDPVPKRQEREASIISHG